METGLRALFLLVALLLLPACGQKADDGKFSGQTMGTTWHVTAVRMPASVNPLDLQQDIEMALTGLDLVFSTYKAESELSQFNQAPVHEWVPVSAELFRVVEQARQISEYSNGAYDVTVGPLVDLWGFGKQDVLQLPPDTAALNSARARVCYRCLELSREKSSLKKTVALEMDLSSIAKGYAVDQVAALLHRQGIEHYLVEIGGEVVTRGNNAEGKPWSLGIEKPEPVAVPTSSSGLQQVIRVSNKAVATSGDYRNFMMIRGKQYSHIIDPATGYPVEHNPASVTVIADNCMLADAWATAFTVLGVDKGLQVANTHGIAVYFVARDPAGNLQVSMTDQFQPYLEQE